MAFGVSANRSSSSSRGPSPGFRFTVYALFAVTLMYLDQRGQWLGEVRYVLQAAAYPVQLAVSSPSAAWRWLQDAARTRDALRAENEQLRALQRELELRTLRYQALARENAELRGLRDALPPVAEKWLVAEVINVAPNTFRHSVLINRGTRNGVFKGQAVLDDQGLIGQTAHVGPWSAEVILITDQEHALPVQIERTGLRTIAVGTGEGLALPYLPANADVEVGDLLVTSGLGGVFPHGYPVGRISAISRESVQPLAQVRAAPLARINRAREVMLVWFRDAHPAAPGSTTGADLLTGDPAIQPQPAPDRSKGAESQKAGDSAKPAAATQSASSRKPDSAAASGSAAGAARAPAADSNGSAQAARPSASSSGAASAAGTSGNSAPAAGASEAVTPPPTTRGAAAPEAGRPPATARGAAAPTGNTPAGSTPETSTANPRAAGTSAPNAPGATGPATSSPAGNAPRSNTSAAGAPAADSPARNDAGTPAPAGAGTRQGGAQ